MPRPPPRGGEDEEEEAAEVAKPPPPPLVAPPPEAERAEASSGPSPAGEASEYCRRLCLGGSGDWSRTSTIIEGGEAARATTAASAAASASPESAFGCKEEEEEEVDEALCVASMAAPFTKPAPPGALTARLAPVTAA